MRISLECLTGLHTSWGTPVAAGNKSMEYLLLGGSDWELIKSLLAAAIVL
jgi:hypothetical protein